MESSTTVASLHFINGVNTVFDLVRCARIYMCVSIDMWVCSCSCLYSMLCARVCCCIRSNAYIRTNSTFFLSLFVVLAILSQYCCTSCVSIVSVIFYLKTICCYCCKCFFSLYALFQYSCAMDFLTSDINIYTAWPHSFFLSFKRYIVCFFLFFLYFFRSATLILFALNFSLLSRTFAISV